jgi:hypothetical protein
MEKLKCTHAISKIRSEDSDPVSETLRSVEHQTMDKFQQPSKPECYTPSSKPVRTKCLEYESSHA